MMKKLCFLSLLSFVTGYSFGQQTTGGVTGYNQFHTAPKGFLTTFAPAPADKPSSIYLYDEWREANVYLSDSTALNDLNVKIDLKENVVDIQHQGGVKILPFSRLLAVRVLSNTGQEETHVSGTTLFGKNHPFSDQLFQVLNSGEVNLYSKYVAERIESKPNAALALAIEDEVVIKKVYMIMVGKRLVIVDSKSALREDLEDIYGDEVAPLLKKVNPKKEEDLLALVSRLEDFDLN